MSYYRLYFMHNGHIQRFADFEAPDDEAALALSREHMGAHALELWNGSRRVQLIQALASAQGQATVHVQPQSD